MLESLKLDILLSDSIINEIKDRIKKHHELYDNKVSSILWEEILFKSFKSNNLKADGNMGGHGAGTDVKCEDISISCKSALQLLHSFLLPKLLLKHRPQGDVFSPPLLRIDRCGKETPDLHAIQPPGQPLSLPRLS